MREVGFGRDHRRRGARAVLRRLWSKRDVRSPQPRLEAQTLVESMHARIGAPGLHQDVMAIERPAMCESGRYYSLAVTTTAQFGMRNHIL